VNGVRVTRVAVVYRVRVSSVAVVHGIRVTRVVVVVGVGVRVELCHFLVTFLGLFILLSSSI